jgi:DNA polymerase III delta prime subunit
VLINLGKEPQPQQVKRPWDADIKIGLKPAEPLPDTTTILEVFDSEEVAGKLLILGNPGSGKTTTQLEIAQELIKRAEEQPDYPVPVLFNLSSWKDDHLSLVDWLVAELKSKYGVSKKLGQEWVNNRQLLPLLDGLDELEPQRQELCVQLINQFLAGETRPLYVVVCSRIEEYSSYSSNLHLNGAISLRELNETQILKYFQEAGQLEFWQTLQYDEALLKLVRTPLFLSITALSVQNLSIEDWQQLETMDARIEHLFDAYWRQQIFNREPSKKLYIIKYRLRFFLDKYIRRLPAKLDNEKYIQQKPPIPEQTRMWLVWLAKQMQREAKTEFLIEEMQPSLLKTKMSKVIYNCIAWGVIPGLIYGLIYGLSIVLIVVLVYGLINGLSGEIIEYKLENIILIRNNKSSHKIIGKWLIIGLIIGLVIGLIYGLTEGLINGLVNGPIFGLVNGLIFGFIGDEIKTFETLKFSYKNFKPVLIYGLIIGLIIGLTYGLIYGELIDVLKYGLIYGLIGGLFFGFSSLEIENKNIPNQGIWQSAKNIPKLLFFYLVPSTILIFLIQQILQNNILPNDNSFSGALFSSLVFGFFFGLLGGMLRGGTPVIKHFTLRLVLYFSGYIPWNYARFLDYCTERMFLQRVGGRYRFIHKMLQDHFAQMEFKRD